MAPGGRVRDRTAAPCRGDLRPGGDEDELHGTQRAASGQHDGPAGARICFEHLAIGQPGRRLCDGLPVYHDDARSLRPSARDCALLMNAPTLGPANLPSRYTHTVGDDVKIPEKIESGSEP